MRAHLRAPDRDGLYTSTEFAVEDVLHSGPAAKGTTVAVRLPVGQDGTGDWHLSPHSPIGPFGERPIRPGERFLLLLSRAFYKDQARARDGAPLPGRTGALSWDRLAGNRIGDRYDPDTPETLTELRRQLRSR